MSNLPKDTQWKPGQSGNPRGRIKDVPSKKQFSLTFWFNHLMENYAKLKPAQRAKISLECWKVLINKAKSLPSDSADSVFNADDAMKQLKALESPTVVQPVDKPSERSV